MDVMGLLILLLPALSTPSLAASREYHLVSQTKNWNDAQSYCREKFSDLATVESEDDWNAMSEMAANSADCVWTGLYNDVNSWRWSLDNTSLVHEHWFRFSADNLGRNSRCAYSYNAWLHDADCDSAFQSICYDEPSSSFIPVTTPMSWLSALSYCRETYTELADVRTQEEWDAITSEAGSTPHWVGLFRDGWKWSDWTESSFRKWDYNQPSYGTAHCVCARVNGWDDGGCEVGRPFICSVHRKRMSKVVLQTDGSVDPNDPQVQDVALKQMEQQLREQGAHQGLRLRWKAQPDGKVFNKTEL